MSVLKTTITKAAFADTNLLPPEEVIKEAVALNTNCATPTVTIQGDAPRVRIPYVETDPTAGVVAEGAEITQTSAALNEIEIATHKVALTIPITNEALTYTDATKLVSTSAANAVTNRVDAMFLSADAAAGAPAGLAKLDGLTTETVTDLKDLAPILTVLSKITDNGGEPSALVMRYSVWARLMALTAKDGRPIEIATHKVALTIPITNEALTYTDATKLVSTSAANAVTNRVDAMFLSADAAAGAPAGLAKLDGLTTETVTDIKDLSPILTVLSKITDNGGEPSALVMRYSVWARLMALTAKDGRPLIAPDVTSSAEPRLFNVPVIFSSYAAADTVLALSAKDVFVSASQVEAAVSKDALFTYDSSVMRLVMRFGYIPSGRVSWR